MTILAPLTGKVLRQLNQQKLEPVDAVPTMLPSWNKMCRDEGGGVGLARGWHVVVAGNTGLGKSLLGLNIAAAAIRHGERVGYISLEMSEIQLATRLQAIVGASDVQKLEHGTTFDLDEANRAADAVDSVHSETGGFVITNDEPVSTLSDILEVMDLLNLEQACSYFVIDYLQLAWTGSADNLLQQITAVSHAVRSAAKRLGVVSVGVSQLNRSISSQRESPIVQGLMGGSPLENDADQVLIFDHTTHKPAPDRSATVDLLLRKNRHGATGKIPCRWDYRTLRLEEVHDWSEVNREDGGT